MKQPTIVVLLAVMSLTACVGQPDSTNAQEPSEQTETPPPSEMVGIVGDGTSMHALELITLDGDSVYFTYEVSQTGGIEIGDTVCVTYDYEQGDDAARSITKYSM